MTGGTRRAAIDAGVARVSTSNGAPPENVPPTDAPPRERVPTDDGPNHPWITVDALNLAGPADAAAELIACCASRRWVSDMVAGRPYPSFHALATASDAALAAIAWPDILEALAAHPRIGDRATGATSEAAWSRQEQSGTAELSSGTTAELVAVNQAYEARFGHVFLICATGLSAQQMIDAARTRLVHDPLAERATVVEELRRIVRLRLAKAFR